MTPITVVLPDDAVGALTTYMSDTAKPTMSDAAKELLMDQLVGIGLLDVLHEGE